MVKNLQQLAYEIAEAGWGDPIHFELGDATDDIINASAELPVELAEKLIAAEVLELDELDQTLVPGPAFDVFLPILTAAERDYVARGTPEY